nr:hypothetical protein [uncultured Carboxylicivirga sp.]
MIRKIILFCFLITSGLSYSQDNLSVVNSNDSIKNFYYRSTFKSSNYLNGREYKTYYNPQKTSPLLDNKLGKGIIYKNNVTYSNITMAYDRNLDELLVMPSNFISDNVYIKMNKAAVDSFMLQLDNKEYHMIYKKFEKDVLPEGFYEIPYKNKYSLIIKYNTSNLYKDGILTYYPKIERYLLKDKECYAINRKKNFFVIFPEHKKELRKKIKSFKTPFKRLSNHQIATLTQFAESL